MGKKFKIFILLVLLIFGFKSVSAYSQMAKNLSGRILLQVEENGEAWYVNPADLKKYYLKRPDDAFVIMKKMGIGITDENLKKIPIGLADYDDQDSDGDGLVNRLEQAMGTDPYNPDTDGDGYGDYEEIIKGYDPLGPGRLPIDAEFSRRQAGKIFIQVASLGEAWYVNPTDNKRYYLGRPSDAFLIMRTLGLGITNQNLSKITTGHIQTDKPDPPVCQDCEPKDPVIQAGHAIRTGNKQEALKYFIPEYHKAVEYTMDYFDAGKQVGLGNLMIGAKIASQTQNKKIYRAEVYFSLGGYKTYLRIETTKQADGTWLISSM